MPSKRYNHTSKDFNFSGGNHFESRFVQLGHLEWSLILLQSSTVG
jgi:hypothetical protein